MIKIFITDDGHKFNSYNEAKEHEETNEYKEYIKGKNSKTILVKELINKGNMLLKEAGVDDELIPWV